MLSSQLDQAFLLASQLHRTQVRKGTPIPYLSHLMAVAALVLEYGGSETQAMAALLHDAAEDQGGRATLELIRSQLGDPVAQLVQDLSDSLEDTRSGETKLPWRERKQVYLDQLEHHSPESLLVSACDKLHNATTILRELRSGRKEIWTKFKGGREGSLWYYQSLVDIFRRTRGIPEDLLAELDQVVFQIHQLA